MKQNSVDGVKRRVTFPLLHGVISHAITAEFTVVRTSGKSKCGGLYQ
jgi:hypothetical protein